MGLLAFVTFSASLWSGDLERHPEFQLEFKCQRRPGESSIAYAERELARIDGIMRRMIADGNRLAARNDQRVRDGDKALEAALAAESKRKTERDTLKALGGGIADHPKASLVPGPSPERVAADAKRSAESQKRAADLEADLVKMAAKDPKYQPILDQYREDLRKARELGKGKSTK